jgi:lipopolysaccharide transport system ATP-binding protein
MSQSGKAVITLKDVGLTYRVRTGLLRSKSFVALHDVSLDIMAGETLGVMGPNGSGKSTLLKLLAGVYKPDAGSIRSTVKKISLLSLALGFDPELSGYDNAILSSMLLGATYKQAQEILPAVMEFSELGKLGDNPIKTYSSGMRARLGFSVALFMQADVLLIDEALAVGDAHFRQKSENAIEEKIASEQTVVLVSHSPSTLRKLCNRVVWLNNGSIEMLGEPEQVVQAYLEAAEARVSKTG